LSKNGSSVGKKRISEEVTLVKREIRQDTLGEEMERLRLGTCETEALRQYLRFSTEKRELDSSSKPKIKARKEKNRQKRKGHNESKKKKNKIFHHSGREGQS